MKTAYQDIYSVLKLNRLVIIVVVVAAFLSSALSGWVVYDTYNKALDNAFAINTNGSVIPLKLVNQKENFMVEALSHLELFHTYFYNIDASNYEKNLEKALWLGNSSVDNLYRQKKADGVYNRLLQYSLVQKVLKIESEIVTIDNIHSFKTITQFEINRGMVTDRYELITTGNLIQVDRNFPNNTHGLLITNYFEKSLKKLSDQNQ